MDGKLLGHCVPPAKSYTEALPLCALVFEGGFGR